MAKIETIRHSLAHIMAKAIKDIYPNAIFATGPAIENGFYYDFLLKEKPDLLKIEERMKEIIKENIPFKKEIVSKAKARRIFKDNIYKLEIIKEIKGKHVGIYSLGDFVDLCKGPHIKNTKEIKDKTFSISKVSGAYFKGNEKNEMLTRIYGLAFKTKEELEEYVELQKEAEKRDHRKLGKELKIFTFSDLVGPGLPLWLPNGTIMIEELEKLAKETEKKFGYLQVKTPHIAKEEMYKISGHLPYYVDDMFPPMILEENGRKNIYYLKAMNCPHHHQIYAFEKRSYRDLPLRLAEYGTCYRYEKSGELFGLMRVRSMQMNDAHIYCTEEQFKEEFLSVIKMYLGYFKIFKIEKYMMRFSTHSKEGLGKKYIDNEKLWRKTEKMVRDVLKKEKIPFVEISNEAAFYGPKIDVQIWSAIGREFTLATNQVDFAVPKRFNLTYVDKNGKEKTPICIHRAPLGTHERTIGFLIEHFGGDFPLWLSPVQVKIITVNDYSLKYAQEIEYFLKKENIRTEIDNENETVSKKIRDAELKKIPYSIIIGEKEIKEKLVSVRKRKEGDLGKMKIEKLIEEINGSI